MTGPGRSGDRGIVVEDLWHAYDERPVLRGISARLTEARIGIIGANGSGKSTLARCFNGLVIPDRGVVTVEGVNVRRHRGRARATVGFMFADAAAQIIMPTPAEDVALSLRGMGRRRGPVDRGAPARVLGEFGLAEHADHPAQLLSSGQKQMLAFASVLVTEPKILVCDEPTTLLDLRNVLRVQRTLAGLTQQVILLTHHLELLADFDRVLVIDDGAIAYDGTPAAAIAAYREIAAR